MSKLSPDIRIPETQPAMLTAIRDFFRQVALQVNSVSEGRIDSHYNARDAIPTRAGKNADIVWKRTVSEQGAADAKYIIIGYICITSGDPGTWREMRVVTGN